MARGKKGNHFPEKNCHLVGYSISPNVGRFKKKKNA